MALSTDSGAVDARLDVGRARRRDEHARPHRSRRGRRCACPSPGRRRTGPGRCRRDARCCSRRRCSRPPGCSAFSAESVGRVEGLVVDQGDRDAVGTAGDRGVDRVDHLVDVAVLRAGPLVGAAEQLACVLRAVTGRHEERVGRHVVDEDELELLRGPEDPAAASTPELSVGRSARREQRGRQHAATAGQGGPASDAGTGAAVRADRRASRHSSRREPPLPLSTRVTFSSCIESSPRMADAPRPTKRLLRPPSSVECYRSHLGVSIVTCVY